MGTVCEATAGADSTSVPPTDSASTPHGHPGSMTASLTNSTSASTTTTSTATCMLRRLKPYSTNRGRVAVPEQLAKELAPHTDIPYTATNVNITVSASASQQQRRDTLPPSCTLTCRLRKSGSVDLEIGGLAAFYQANGAQPDEDFILLRVVHPPAESQGRPSPAQSQGRPSSADRVVGGRPQLGIELLRVQERDPDLVRRMGLLLAHRRWWVGSEAELWGSLARVGASSGVQPPACSGSSSGNGTPESKGSVVPSGSGGGSSNVIRSGVLSTAESQGPAPSSNDSSTAKLQTASDAPASQGSRSKQKARPGPPSPRLSRYNPPASAKALQAAEQRLRHAGLDEDDTVQLCSWLAAPVTHKMAKVLPSRAFTDGKVSIKEAVVRLCRPLVPPGVKPDPVAVRAVAFPYGPQLPAVELRGSPRAKQGGMVEWDVARLGPWLRACGAERGDLLLLWAVEVEEAEAKGAGGKRGAIGEVWGTGSWGKGAGAEGQEEAQQAGEGDVGAHGRMGVRVHLVSRSLVGEGPFAAAYDAVSGCR